MGLVVLGLSAGAFQTVNSTMILGMRPVRRAGTVNGIRTTAQQTAVSLGTALLISLGTGRSSATGCRDYFAGRADRLDAAARDALVAGHVVAVCVLVGVMRSASSRWRRCAAAARSLERHDHKPRDTPCVPTRRNLHSM